MEGRALVRERPQRMHPGPAYAGQGRAGIVGMGRENRSRHQDTPHIAVLFFRWTALYVILMSALWAFSGPADPW